MLQSENTQAAMTYLSLTTGSGLTFTAFIIYLLAVSLHSLYLFFGVFV